MRRFKKKKTWLKMVTKSGKEYLGQITSYDKREVILEYSRRYCGKDYSLKTILQRNQIEAIECLSCENSNVWTLGK